MALKADNLCLSYDMSGSSNRLHVLEDISLDVPKGAYYSIIGPSGCGKTTILQCLAGLIPATAGAVSLESESPVTVRDNHRVGFVFQKPLFFEWMSIQANVALAATISGKNDAAGRASRYLEVFHLDGFAKSFPHELSGGMLARAALARALVHEPDYLFLDEAFNHLDEALRDEINLDIQSMWLKHTPTVVAVTHSIAEAVLMSDRILVFSKRPARIQSAFDVPFNRPRSLALRRETQFVALVEEIRRALSDVYGSPPSHAP